MAGKRQKLPEQLQGKGSAHRGESSLVLVPRDAQWTPPAPPEGLPTSLHPVWEAYWGSRVSQLVEPADAYDVGRFFVLLAEREKHERMIRAKPLVMGSMGQEVVNPRLALVKELTREIEKMREQLGILPLSRLRLGIAENVEKASGVKALRDGLNGAARPDKAIEADAIVNLDELG